MVCGSGMNGRTREARSSSGGQHNKKQVPSQRTAQKPTPPAEALQMARILEDSKQMSELNSKVEAVLAVVPGCTEEQIHLALHDNGFDLDKAISALLDSDGQSNEGEWTTTSRKGRKKGGVTDGEETSTHSKVTSGRASSRTTSNSTRESSGGGVSANTGTGGRGRGQSNRGKGQSSGRRPRVGGSTGDQRRSRTKDRTQSSVIQPPQNKAIEEEWDTLPLVTTEPTATAENWAIGEEAWQTPLTENSTDNKYWESVAPPDDTIEQEMESQLRPLFPEALPAPDRPLQLHATPSEITPTQPTTSGGEREVLIQHSPSESREKVTRKPKRLARSRIPTKPVEMPAGIESLDVQFGELGIDFVGLESPPSPGPATPTTAKELNIETSVAGILPYSDLQQSFGDSSVNVSISTSSSITGLGMGEGGTVLTLEPSFRSSTEHSEADREVPTSAGLRSPPGLPHPSSSSSAEQQGQGETTTSSLTVTTEVQSSQQTSVENQLNLQEVPPSSVVLKPSPIELPMELPKRQNITPQTTAIEQSYSSVSNSVSDKMMFSTSANVSSSVSSGFTSGSSSRTASVTPSSSLSTSHHQQHLSQQQSKPGSGNVPPGMLYPHMMPGQYLIPAPAMYNYDPNDMSRYSSGSMAYFPTSSDPSLGGAMSSRDHTSSSFQTQTEQPKFPPPRGSADISTAIAVSSTQQNQPGTSLTGQPGGAQPAGSGQMGPAFMGAPYFGSMFYPTMYGPMPAFSQATNFGMSYEEMVAAAAAAAPTSHDYSKMYAGGSATSINKPSSLPVSSSVAMDNSGLGGAASSSFKQLDTGKSYNYSVPAGVGGSQAPGYYMQMPFPHMMVGPGGHDVGGVAPHSRMSQQKHSNKVGSGGYQGNSGTASYWGSAAAHSS